MLKSPTMMRSLSSEVFSFRFRSIHSARDCSSTKRPAGVPHCACAARKTKSKLPALNDAMKGSRHQSNLGRYRLPTFSRGGLAVAANPLNATALRSEEHTSELQSQSNLVCRLLLEKKKEAL